MSLSFARRTRFVRVNRISGSTTARHCTNSRGVGRKRRQDSGVVHEYGWRRKETWIHADIRFWRHEQCGSIGKREFFILAHIRRANAQHTFNVEMTDDDGDNDDAADDDVEFLYSQHRIDVKRDFVVAVRRQLQRDFSRQRLLTVALNVRAQGKSE